MKISEKIFNAIFYTIPLPFSKWLYLFTRKMLFPELRREYFEKIVLKAKELNKEGDYLEFGVYRGKSMYEFMSLFKRHGMDKLNYYAFDSFKGLPESEGKVFSKGEFTFPKAHFIKRLKKSGFPVERLHVTEGFFGDSLTTGLKQQLPLRKASMVHIDCDLYESTRVVLRWVEEYMDVGTILIFDDYFSFDKMDNPEDYGEKKAFREWKYHTCFEGSYELPSSKCFIMTKPRAKVKGS